MNSFFVLPFHKIPSYRVTLFAVIVLVGCSSPTRKAEEGVNAFVNKTQVCKAGLTKVLLINNTNNVTEIIGNMDAMQNELINGIGEQKLTENFAKLQDKPCKNGFVSLPKILDQLADINPQAKMAKEKLKAEFSQRDKDLVAMRANVKNGYVSEDDAKEAQEKFKADFNKRRNEEVLAVQQTVVAAVRIVAKNDQYDIVAIATDKTEDAEKIRQMASLDDLTPDVIRQLSLPTQTENKPLEKNPLRIVN
ncbi:MAG: OmpH family outer membrane protein [Methylovulum sp.]|nr:OmpH family outer membrane protein [Methylovulum sp.]